MWGAYALGRLYAVSALFLVVWAAALGISLRTAGAGRAGAAGPLFALVAVLVCQTRFEQRPEVFSYALLALQIHWLRTWPQARAPSGGELGRFAAAQAVWSNLHGYFAFGPLLVGVALVAAAAAPRGPGWARGRPARLGLALLLPLTILASVASPFGWRNWAEVAVLWHFLGAMRLRIMEFIPPSGLPLRWWTVKLFWGYWGATLLAAAYVLRTGARRELFALLLAAAGLYLSATAYRNIPLVVFLSAPLAGPLLARFGGRLPDRAGRLAVIAAGAALAGWIPAGFYRSIGSSADFGIGESAFAYPTFFADYLRAGGFPGPIFARAADGGYLEFHFPDQPLYGDSRFTDPILVDEYFRAVTDPAAFRELQRRYGFAGVLLPVAESRAVLGDLLRDPGWRLAYADLHRAFLVNLSSEAGRAAPIQPPLFYRGEDLTIPFNGLSAVRWTDLLVQAGDRADLLLDLRQLARAPRIPSVVLQSALHDGQGRPDAEVVAAVAALRPRMVAPGPTDAEFVDWLLGRPAP